MALGISTNSGDFLPIVKFNAKAGRWIKVENNGTVKEEIDITNGFAAIFDFDNIKIGWMSFEGGKPDFRMKPFGQDIGPQPSDDHRQGAQIQIRLSATLGGERHELSAASGALLGALDELHDQYLKEANGRLPIVKHIDVTAQKTNHGTNYAPKLEIVDWVERSKFDGDSSASAPVSAQPTPAAQAAPQQTVAPPPADNAPQAATADMTAEF